MKRQQRYTVSDFVKELPAPIGQDVQLVLHGGQNFHGKLQAQTNDQQAVLRVYQRIKSFAWQEVREIITDHHADF
ncbi:MAG: hypothetical protein ACFCUI_07310 [Bernardetiaceae bacterium]